jgi:hypothetical protein
MASSRRIISRDSIQLPVGRQRVSTWQEDVEDPAEYPLEHPLEDRKITRSELEEILLQPADVLVSEDRINQIFLQANTEGTGFVLADDVADRINSIEPRTQKERQNHIHRSILTSISFWCAILFVVGAIIANMITNLRQREYGDLHGEEFYYYFQVGAWTYQIGCLGFLFLDYEFERIAFESLQLMDQELVRWIRRGMYPPVYIRIFMISSERSYRPTSSCFCRFAPHMR